MYALGEVIDGGAGMTIGQDGHTSHKNNKSNKTECISFSSISYHSERNWSLGGVSPGNYTFSSIAILK